MVTRIAAVLLMLLYSVSGTGAEIKIGFVDIPYLIDEAPQAHAASSRLETEFAPRQAGIKAQKSVLARLKNKLDNEEGDLDDGERTNIEREFRMTERRIKRDEQEFREELNLQKNIEFKQVRVYVLDAIATFAKHHGYDIILSDGVLFANKRVDVTEQVLVELQQTAELNADDSQSDKSKN